MSHHNSPAGIDVTIPDLVGIAAKRRSLGQFQGAFERQVTVLEADCRIADPNRNGTNSHCNEAMLDILEGSRIKLETAFTKWTLRLNQLLEEDTDETNIAEYREKWANVPKMNTEAKLLLVRTLTNIKKPSGAGAPIQNERNEAQQGAIKPINELKPYTLEKFSTPGRFQDWRRRFKSFFLSSNLHRAQIETQHAYFRNCISSQLSNLLDSQIAEDLPIYPDPQTPEDTSSCMTLLQVEIERRHPLALRRLALFSTKQASMSFSDYIALVKKKSETADTSSFTTDNILSYIVLSGCNDQEILEEVLKLSKNPDFEQIVQIGTNLEVSRSILRALPGSQTTAQHRAYKVTSRYKKKRTNQTKTNERKTGVSEVENNRCNVCGSTNHHSMQCPVPPSTKCYKCGGSGHLSYVCESEQETQSDINETENAEGEVDPESDQESENTDDSDSNNESENTDDSDSNNEGEVDEGDK